MAREGTLVARRDKCVAASCQNGCGQERGGAGGPVKRGGVANSWMGAQYAIRSCASKKRVVLK